MKSFEGQANEIRFYSTNNEKSLDKSKKGKDTSS